MHLIKFAGILFRPREKKLLLNYYYYLLKKIFSLISTTLTESEKGNLPPLELISRPERAQMAFKENQPPVINYPWDKSK